MRIFNLALVFSLGIVSCCCGQNSKEKSQCDSVLLGTWEAVDLLDSAGPIVSLLDYMDYVRVTFLPGKMVTTYAMEDTLLCADDVDSTNGDTIRVWEKSAKVQFIGLPQSEGPGLFTFKMKSDTLYLITVDRPRKFLKLVRVATHAGEQ